MGRKESERKPLSFSTTMRNPERIAKFLSCVLPYENQILTHDIIVEIIKLVLNKKLYKPTIIDKTEEFKRIYDDETLEFSNKQLEYIMEQCPQKHKEFGFEWGWESRFDTWFRLPKEFGFIYYWKGEKIIISNVGHMLVDAVNENPVNELKIQNVFLNSLAKYRTNNAFRKNSNDNIPLLVLLNVLKLFKEDSEENGSGLHINELSFLICWPDSNYNEIYKYIKEIRREFGFNLSEEVIYEKCLDLLEASSVQTNRFKKSQILKEAIDEYIRKMRSTGVISLRGAGRFIDFNTFEMNKINYVIDKYSEQEVFTIEKSYFNYVGQIDTNILTAASIANNIKEEKRLETLNKLSEEYSKEDIYKELSILTKKNDTSQNPIFRLIPYPARLEFLTSIALKQNFENLIVLPNYPVDDEGIPTSTAGGGTADIYCYDNKNNANFEVTMMCGRQDQINNEIVPIRRHLLETRRTKPNAFSVFLAPKIHEDVIEMTIWYKHKDLIDIIPLEITQFVSKIQTINEISNFLNN